MRCYGWVLVAITAVVASHAAAQTVKVCSWFAYTTAPPEPGYCYTNDNYYITVKPEPSTFIAKQLTRVYGRAFLCSQFKTNSTCSAQAKGLGCYWSSSGEGSGLCRNQEHSDWSWFQRHTYLDAPSPSWTLCPGSQADTMHTCSNIGILDPKACQANKQCTYSQKNGCQATFLTKMTKAQSDKWWSEYHDMKASVHGNCAGICYLRQVTSCSLPVGKTPDKQAAWCKSKSYCSWDATNKRCAPNLFGNDAWGKAAQAATAQCSTATASTNRKSCEGTAGGAAANLARILTYKDFMAPNTTVPCPL